MNEGVNELASLPSRGSGDEVRRSALAHRLNSAALRLVRRVRREDRELGQTSAGLSVMSTLVNRGPTALKELAEIEQVRAPTLTRLVQALERDGYVLRRPDRRDARVSVITHTSRGWRLLEDVQERRMGVLRTGLASLQPDELRTLEEAAALIERLAVAGEPRASRAGAAAALSRSSAARR